MEYISTRGDGKRYTSSLAVIQGLADDGGLFVPESFPRLTVPVNKLCGRSYKDIAFEVLRLFFTDFTDEELKSCIDKAYDIKFDTEEIAPVTEHGGMYFLELFHGRTIAFKDMALSILPHLLKCSLKKNNVSEKVIIMTATSGDTGKAALEAFAGVEDTKIIVFYPKGGVSRIQERQMVTQRGDNTKVVGVVGNFDDCQSAVKRMFSDEELNREIKELGYRFSSANSINIGRLIPQVAYYLYAYVRMVERGAVTDGESLNFTVPTGNFGNILAGFYAKQLGVPVGKLICASNDNKVLYDFFDTGVYDRNRDFILTTSPSMDILISSNLERLIYHSTGDAAENARLMGELADIGRYEISDASRKYMDDFTGIWASEDKVRDTIRVVYDRCGYVIDTHTAVAAYADMKYREGNDGTSVVVSTASPYKFMTNVLSAIDESLVSDDDFEMARKLSEISHVAIPEAIKALEGAPVLHDRVCAVDDMKDEVISLCSQEPA